MNPGGSRGPTGNSGQSGDFDGQHTYVIQDNRRESQDEELEGAGKLILFIFSIWLILSYIFCKHFYKATITIYQFFRS